eukprot:GHVP01023782.1.p2 GENE.GHVP01023782.1~~GHVP01023782.1.p2  ORF type:complete len:132 (+),score=21.20 GHVP01023782.1:539-934(+)
MRSFIVQAFLFLMTALNCSSVLEKKVATTLLVTWLSEVEDQQKEIFAKYLEDQVANLPETQKLCQPIEWQHLQMARITIIKNVPNASRFAKELKDRFSEIVIDVELDQIVKLDDPVQDPIGGDFEEHHVIT